MRRLVSIFLLTVSAVLLMVGLASKEMRTKGIVTVRLDVPRLDPRQPLDLPAIPKFSDLPDLPSLPDGVNSVATAIATRVSAAVSQPTGFLVPYSMAFLARLPLGQIRSATEAGALQKPAKRSLLRSRSGSPVPSTSSWTSRLWRERFPPFSKSSFTHVSSQLL